MKKVSFTEMKNGTKEDYLFLDKHEKDFASKTADRILKFCLLYTSPSPRDAHESRMPSSA